MWPCLLLTIAALLPGVRTETVTSTTQMLVGRAGFTDPGTDDCYFYKGQTQRTIEDYDGKLKCGTGEFMSSVTFKVESNEIRFTGTTCTSQKCCREQLGLLNGYVLITPLKTLDNNTGVLVGDELADEFSAHCKKDGNKIRSRTVECVSVTEDGTGWNLLKDPDTVCTPCSAGTRYNSASNECEDCPQGQYSGEGKTECEPCPVGHYVSVQASHTCTMCEANTYSAEKGASQCTPCAEGEVGDKSIGSTSCSCGDGYVARDDGEEGCIPCKAGTFYDSADKTCYNCPQGSYSEEGATDCHCNRGLVRSARDPSVCEYCPAGHTTYPYAPNTCIGPQLHGMDRRRNHLLTARVGYTTLENLNNAVWRWESTGNWYLYRNKAGRNRVGLITQAYTVSYKTGGRNIMRPRIVKVEPIINNVYCYVDKGAEYRGYANKTSSGKDCTGPYCTRANKKDVCYCRNGNPDSTYDRPYCKNTAGVVEYCDIPRCKGAGEAEEVTDDGCPYEEVRSVSVSELDSITEVQFTGITDAKITCDKLGGECTGVWLSGTGGVLTVKLTGLIPPDIRQGTNSAEASFLAKSPDCVNPYYEHYFTQSYD